MTLHFDTKTLREAVAALQPVLSGKSGLPALGAVEFRDGPERLYLSATNLDVWVRYELGGLIEQADHGSFCLPGRLLHEALARITVESLTLTVKGPECVLQAGSAKLRLPLVLDPFTAIPEASWSQPVLIDDLQVKLRKCLPFVSKDTSRYVLNAVYFGKNAIEAANGKTAICMEEPGLNQNAIAPTELCQLIARTEGTVTLRFTESLMEAAGEGWAVTGKLIESETKAWVNTAQLYSFEPIGKLTGSAAELSAACSLAAFSLPSLIDAVKVKSDVDGLTFWTNGGEVKVAAELDQPMQWAVNARYFAAMLGVFPDDAVQIDFSDSNAIRIQQGPIKALTQLMRANHEQ